MPTLFDRYQDPNLTSDWAQVGVTNFFSDEKSIGFTTNQNLQDPQTQFISIAGQTSYGISDNSTVRLSVDGITWPGTGQIGGRHGGTVGSPESIPPSPPHDIEHTLYDDGAGTNLSQIGGRHGGTEGAPEHIPPIPPHDTDHSLYDLGAGTNLSQIGGRHGGTEGAPESIPPTPAHPTEHSLYDVGAGINHSEIGGRHGGVIGAPESIPPSPPHDPAHSIYDNGTGINYSLISGRYSEGDPHPAMATGGEVMDIMTPGERLGGVDVGRVQPVYTPISQILGDPDALF